MIKGMIKMATKAKTVWDIDFSHLSIVKQGVLFEILDAIGELEKQIEEGANPNKVKNEITSLKKEFFEIYNKAMKKTSIEQILIALQSNDFHADLLHFIADCNGLNEMALRSAYKVYKDSEWRFQKQYSFFRFYFFTITVNGLYDIDGNRVNPETGFEYRGPYNMRFPSTLLSQWELGPSIKNPVLTVEGLKRYSKKTLYENYGFQLNNGNVLV